MRPKDGVMVNIKIEIGFLNDYVPTKFAGQEVYMYFLAETSDGRKVDFGRIRYGSSRRATFTVLTSAQCEQGSAQSSQEVHCYTDCARPVD